MTYLLDTNIFVILINQEFSRLSVRQKEVLSDQNVELVLSTARIYEMSIKERLSKLQLDSGFEKALDIERKILKIKLLPVNQSDYRRIVSIPKIVKKDNKPHGDPFDLLIISQAYNHNLPVLTTDEYFAYYPSLQVIE